MSDSLRIASFVMLGDTELIERTADALYNHRDFPKYEIECGLPRGQGHPARHALARLCQVNYIVVRKSVKSYMQDPVVEEVQSITTAGWQMRGRRAGSGRRSGRGLRGRQRGLHPRPMVGLERLLNRAGCKVICKVAVLLEEGG